MPEPRGGFVKRLSLLLPVVASAALGACSTTPPPARTVEANPQLWSLGQSAAAHKAMVAAFGSTALKPGGFVWRKGAMPAGPTDVVVSLRAQMAYVYRAGELVGASTISSGKPGHETPVGVFPILEKRKIHESNRYSEAPMPYMQRLNWHGVALHGGTVAGTPASHGCVRLPMAFAQKLFDLTSIGSQVIIEDY